MGESVAKYTALPVSGVVDFEVHEERLFIAPEITPCDVVDGGVGPHFYRYGLGRGAVVHEHLSDFRVDHVGGVVTDVDVLGEQELADYEIAVLIGQDVYRLDCRSSVPRPHYVDLDG